MSHGLAAGLALRLDVDMGAAVESFATRLEDVNERQLTVLVPMRRLEERPLPKGAPVHVTYRFAERMWGFESVSLGASPDAYYQYLSLPDRIDSTDRRSAFRLKANIQPESVYRMVVDPERVTERGGVLLECTVVDLSQGGVCLSSRHNASLGEWLGLHMELPGSGELKARMRVVGAEAPPKGRRNHRLHCVFVDLSPADQDRIARYLLKRQLDMRQRGQL